MLPSLIQWTKTDLKLNTWRELNQTKALYITCICETTQLARCWSAMTCWYNKLYSSSLCGFRTETGSRPRLETWWSLPSPSLANWMASTGTPSTAFVSVWVSELGESVSKPGVVLSALYPVPVLNVSWTSCIRYSLTRPLSQYIALSVALSGH